MKEKNIETLLVHGTYKPDHTGATNPPIYMSNAYEFESAQYAADLFSLKAGGYIYSRLHNPTTTTFEETIAAMDEGTAAVATSSGHFAVFMTILTLAQIGDEIIASNKLYGGTLNLFKHTFKRFGITVKFANQDDISSFEALVTDKTKGIFIESITNPSADIIDFEAIADVAKRHKIPLIVDNTCATPYLFKPKDIGADVVVYSSTKYIGGHGTALGGVVVDLGTFDWTCGRFPDFTEPDPSYHGVVAAEAFGNMALAIKMRVNSMRDLGGTPSPYNSSMFIHGLQTLHVRMDRHVKNAYELAKFLESHDKVAWVNYSGLETSPYNALVKKYLPKGAGSLFSFGLKGGREAGRKFIDNIEVCVHAANLGDVKTIVTHPASTTHSQLTAEALQQSGIGEDMVRVSVGIESIEDLKADFDKALNSL